MALYTGDTILVRAEARDPYTREILEPMPAKCTVAFWGPGKSRKKDLADYGPYEMRRHVERGIFMFYAETQGWIPGNWTYVLRMEDVVVNKEVGTFVLED